MSIPPQPRYMRSLPRQASAASFLRPAVNPPSSPAPLWSASKRPGRAFRPVLFQTPDTNGHRPAPPACHGLPRRAVFLRFGRRKFAQSAPKHFAAGDGLWYTIAGSHARRAECLCRGLFFSKVPLLLRGQRYIRRCCAILADGTFNGGHLVLACRLHSAGRPAPPNREVKRICTAPI